MQKFTFSTWNYRINISGIFQNMVPNTSKSSLWIKFGYVNLDHIWWKKRRIKPHFIVFLQNCSGISRVVKVTSDIYAIVLVIRSSSNRYIHYHFLFFLTIASRDTWLYCRTAFTRYSDRFRWWIGHGDGWLGWLGWWNWGENGGVDGSLIALPIVFLAPIYTYRCCHVAS